MKGSSSSYSSSASSSSAVPKKPSTAPKGAAFGRRKKPVNIRDPLQEVNGAVSSSSGTNASCSSSISSSIEAPRGCLRFFLSHSSSAKAKTPLRNRSGAHSGTPKSAPAPKPKKNPNPLRYGGNFKTFSVSGNVRTDLLKRNQGPELRELDSSGVRAANCTPVSKVPNGSRLGLGMQCRVDESSNGKETRITTPPIEASVSPEIQCNSLKVLSTVKMASGTASPQPCYGAGHVLSGIPDKRKCKPRGILTVIDCDSQSNTVRNVLTNAGADDCSESSVLGFGKSSGLSPVPMPCEASMHWLSPRYEKGEEDQKDKSPTQGLEGSILMSLCSTSPSLSGTGFSSDVLCKSSLTSSTTDASSGNSKSQSSVLRRSSGGRLLDFKGFARPKYEMSSPSHMTQVCSGSNLKEGKECSFYVERDDPPFSACLLDSGHVIRAPNSDSAKKNPWEDKLDSEANLVARVFDKVTLSPEHHGHHLSTWDPADLSFWHDYLNTPFNSIDLAQLQKAVDSKAASWVSNSASDFIPSQDPLRISWRDGLVSRIFEMDEYDCCRCFSDEEEGSSKKLNDCPEQSGGIRDNTELQTEQKIEIDSQVQSMSLDSVSSDGDHLIRSDDSNWNLCYKNRLFAAYDEKVASLMGYIPTFLTSWVKMTKVFSITMFSNQLMVMIIYQCRLHFGRMDKNKRKLLHVVLVQDTQELQLLVLFESYHQAESCFVSSQITIWSPDSRQPVVLKDWGKLGKFLHDGHKFRSTHLKHKLRFHTDYARFLSYDLENEKRKTISQFSVANGPLDH